jgi:cytidyltransferase-like protein
MKRIVLITGGFDPLHSGHIAYFNAAKKLGDWLIVGINSDFWLTKKKGRPFMPVWERYEIINNLKNCIINFNFIICIKYNNCELWTILHVYLTFLIIN